MMRRGFGECAGVGVVRGVGRLLCLATVEFLVFLMRNI